MRYGMRALSFLLYPQLQQLRASHAADPVAAALSHAKHSGCNQVVALPSSAIPKRTPD